MALAYLISHTRYYAGTTHNHSYELTRDEVLESLGYYSTEVGRLVLTQQNSYEHYNHPETGTHYVD